MKSATTQQRRERESVRLLSSHFVAEFSRITFCVPFGCASFIIFRNPNKLANPLHMSTYPERRLSTLRSQFVAAAALPNPFWLIAIIPARSVSDCVYTATRTPHQVRLVATIVIGNTINPPSITARRPTLATAGQRFVQYHSASTGARVSQSSN